MSAAIVPFPLAKRRTMIDRQARYAAEINPDAAVRHIQQQLKIQGDAMRRKGVDDNLVARELKSMEAAIRTLRARAMYGVAQMSRRSTSFTGQFAGRLIEMLESPAFRVLMAPVYNCYYFCNQVHEVRFVRESSASCCRSLLRKVLLQRFVSADVVRPSDTQSGVSRSRLPGNLSFHGEISCLHGCWATSGPLATASHS
jgi:hypothetical protein